MPVPVLFNRHLVRLHRDRAVLYHENLREVVWQCYERLLERLTDIKRSFTRILEMGGRGMVAPYFQERGIEVVSADLSCNLVRLNVSYSGSMVCMDEEFLPFKEQAFDLVLACFNLHWVNDLPGTLLQIRKLLRPDGLFLAAIPILPSLAPLRAVMTEVEMEVYEKLFPRISPLPDLRSCAVLMQRAGFSLPVIDKEKMVFSYQSPLALMRDLRWAGETNALYEHRREFDGRSFFAECFSRLQQNKPLQVSFDFAVLTGWAPDASQPQPLKPGQFEVSLEEALQKRVGS